MSKFMRHELEPHPWINITSDCMARANVGRRYWQADPAKIPASCGYKARLIQYLADIHSYERDGKGLLLHGSLGSGKTAAATLVIREAVRRAPLHAWFITAQGIDHAARNRREETPNGRKIWDLLVGGQILVIDDLGAERNTDWNGRWIEQIVRTRYHEQLLTVITTNITPEILAADKPWLGSLMGETFVSLECDGNWRGAPEAEAVLA